MKKTFVILLLVIPLLLAACTKEESGYTNLSEMELSGNQTLVTGQVTDRVGNDIDLALGTLSQAQFPGDTGTMPSGDMGSMPSGDMGAMPSGDRGSMPSGDRGAMPSGGPNGDGGMPAGGSGSSTDTAQGSSASDGSSENAAGASVQIQLSGETMSLSIPVGTKVLVTSDGSLLASSFGRIQVDDILQLIVQTNADGSQTVILAQIME